MNPGFLEARVADEVATIACDTAADRRRRLKREPGGARAQRVDHCEQATAAAHGSCHGAVLADDFLGDREVEPAPRVAASSGRIAKVEIPEPYNMNSVRVAAEEQSASYGNVLNPSGCFCFCLFVLAIAARNIHAC